jgi:hypothetical protein
MIDVLYGRIPDCSGTFARVVEVKLERESLLFSMFVTADNSFREDISISTDFGTLKLNSAPVDPLASFLALSASLTATRFFVSRCLLFCKNTCTVLGGLYRTSNVNNASGKHVDKAELRRVIRTH